ncbi:hypothetical protein FJT64_027057 [Amphibalanus amphitrite]|uniref:CCHC-type domain-containing protein n=2 Tax=Amphibalanus amphitrite TaxID=1232801 RepID=A0A6A4W9M6_AMPAM|nr:hypothetical protein FJT64_027057 [Amphibalanus amphitrite]
MFGRGRGHDEYFGLAKEKGLDAYEAQVYATTRFTSSAFNQFTTIYKGYEGYVTAYSDLRETKDDCEEMRYMVKGQDYCLDLCGIIDVFSPVVEMMTKGQSLGHLLWACTKWWPKLRSILVAQAVNIREQVADTQSLRLSPELFPKLASHFMELSGAEPSFKNIALEEGWIIQQETAKDESGSSCRNEWFRCVDNGKMPESDAVDEFRVIKKDSCLEDEYEFRFGGVSVERNWRLVESRLSPAVQQLVARCGSAAHLVADTLLVADDLVKNHGPGQQAHITGQELWARPTDNAGFVTLHWVRTDRCGHEEPLEALPADSVRRMMVDYCRVMMDVWPDGAPWDTSFGVHLVPTGRPGSKTEFIEYRISLSRAELLAVRQLCPGLRAAVTALKAIKNILKESGVAIGDLKSYFMKTAALWVAQEPHGGPRTGVTDGVHRLLDWLERRLDDGVLPCFFYPAINVAAELTADQRQAIIGSLRLWYHHMMSGTHRQQCYLLMAWSVVDPADLADGEPMTSPVGDVTVTLDVTPLTRLLTDSDLDDLLGEPAAVAAWCRRERPAGLTAEPDTPRGRAELLLRPELLLRALVHSSVYKLPEMDGPTVVATAGLWRRRLQQLLSGDRLRAAYDAAVGRWPDRWQLLQHYLAEDDTQAARRIMTKRGTVSTNNIILTFDSTDLPSEIRVGYVKVRVRPFVPAPMRCFRCQRFGHTKDNCRGRPTCSKCASQDHTDETCDSETPRCVNCGEGQTPHSAYDRSCPAYVKEKEIMTIKATRNLSFKEAREVYNQSHPKTSYAQKEALRRGEEERKAREARRARLVQKALEAKEASSADSASGNSPQGDRDGGVEDEEQHCDEEEQTSEGPPHPHGQRWQLIEQQHQQLWKELELQHQQLWQELENPGNEERVRMDKEHEEERRHLEQKHGTEWQNLDERHYEERIELHQQHKEDTGCLNMPTEDQLRQLDLSHQQQWENIQQVFQQQWQQLEQRHQRESRELDERFPSIRSGEELDRQLEECRRKCHQLRQKLEKQLQEQEQDDQRQSLLARQKEEREQLLRQHEEDSRGLNAPAERQPQPQRSMAKGQRKEQSRRQRRQRAVLEQQHAAQWAGLRKKLRTQRNKMERRHQQETQELEELFRTVRSGERFPSVQSERRTPSVQSGLNRLLNEFRGIFQQLGAQLEEQLQEYEHED